MILRGSANNKQVGVGYFKRWKILGGEYAKRRLGTREVFLRAMKTVWVRFRDKIGDIAGAIVVAGFVCCSLLVGQTEASGVRGMVDTMVDTECLIRSGSIHDRLKCGGSLWRGWPRRKELQ